MASSDENAKELVRRENKLFEAKSNLDQLNQELALNFYPERADFTIERCIGSEFAVDLFDSEPLRCRRDLGNARASMLRPRGNQWFKAQLGEDRLNEDPGISRHLDAINARARALLYRARSGFVKAEKQADHDLVTFGGAIKTVEAVRGRDGDQNLLVRCWHPRDCAYLDDADGIGQDFMARRFKASARHIRKTYQEAKLHSEIETALERDPDQEFSLCHVMMRAEEYEYYKKPKGPKTEWVSVYYDSAHQMILRERPSQRFRYIVDKWGELAGTQYPYSPAAMTALPDGRGIQTMALVLLEAGEKSLDPPMVATRGAVKSDIDMSAGAVIWVDDRYDEKLGPSIRPLLPDNIKPPIGIELINRTTFSLRDTWYLTKLTLPQQAKTAYETQQLVEEFIRANIPLFEPWEAGLERMLDEIFGVFLDMGEFGSLADWPPAFSGRDLEFSFSNPLQDAIERNKVNQASQVFGILAAATQIDPNARHAIDVIKVVQDGTRGTGAPADWLPDEQVTQQNIAATQQTGNILGAIDTAGRAADVVNTGAEAAGKLQQLNQPAVDGSGVYGPT